MHHDAQKFTTTTRPRAASSEIRPDWDLSAAGLRDAWNAGDLSPFHGWNKSDRSKPEVA